MPQECDFTLRSFRHLDQRWESSKCLRAQRQRDVSSGIQGLCWGGSVPLCVLPRERASWAFEPWRPAVGVGEAAFPFKQQLPSAWILQQQGRSFPSSWMLIDLLGINVHYLVYSRFCWQFVNHALRRALTWIWSLFLLYRSWVNLQLCQRVREIRWSQRGGTSPPHTPVSWMIIMTNRDSGGRNYLQVRSRLAM